MNDATAAVPTNREQILEQAGARGRFLFKLVRHIADLLDTAAPWNELYDPPGKDSALLAMAKKLYRVVDEIPGQVQQLFEQLAELANPTDMSSGELAAHFDNTFLIVSRDRDQLMHALEQADDGALDNDRRGHLCAVCADLKGKYRSALMGVAGKVIAGDRWSAVEIEPLLFAEKKTEFERNHQLVDALENLAELIRDLPESLPMVELVQAWSEGRRVDRYALVSLSVLVGAVGRLLTQSSRRALYSGDYHEILQRERLLSERVRKLQIMHASTWSESAKARLAGIYPRLVELMAEIAAVLDIRLLREVVGEQRFAALSAAADKEPGDSLAELCHDDFLAEQLRLQDLRSFLDQLLVNVLKRASVVAASDRRLASKEGDDPRGRVRRELELLTSPVSPQWQAFLAAVADPATAPTHVLELRDSLHKRLVPRLQEVEELAQFGKYIAASCAEIESAEHTQPMHTILRLLNRLRELLDES